MFVCPYVCVGHCRYAIVIITTYTCQYSLLFTVNTNCFVVFLFVVISLFI